MFRRSSDRYVVLQEHVPVRERQTIERILVSVMRPIEPSQSFVNRLSRDLTDEARRQYSVQQRHADRALRLFGIVGGLLSVVGGGLLWLLLQQERELPPAPKRAFSHRKPSAVPRST